MIDDSFKGHLYHHRPILDLIFVEVFYLSLLVSLFLPAAPP